MRIDSLRIHRIRLPLRSPFETSFKRQTEREALILELGADVDGREAIGWGECVALPDPSYSAEYNDAASDVIQRFLVPLLAERDDVTAETLAHDLRKVCGHRMAKAAIEMAVLDAELRARGVSMAEHLGGVTDRVPSGVSVGIHESPAELVDAVEGYLDEGYVRIKIKIKPGHDIDDVRAVREAIGHEVPLQVDANAAYGLVDARHLARLDLCRGGDYADRLVGCGR